MGELPSLDAFRERAKKSFKNMQNTVDKYTTKKESGETGAKEKQIYDIVP